MRAAVPLLMFLTQLAAFSWPYQLEIEVRGSWPGFPGGDAIGICVVSNRAYVVGPSLQIFDIETPTQPVRLGGIGLPIFGPEMDVAVTNDVAYMVDRESLLVADVANPDGIVPLDAIYLDEAYALELEGNRCYVSGSYWNGAWQQESLRIFDVSNPTNLTFLGEVQAGGRSDVVGNLAYLASETYGLLIFDVTDPSAPIFLGQRLTERTARDIRVEGANAHLVTDYGLEIFDVSNPAAPAPLGTYRITLADHLDVQEQIAYVTGGLGDDLIAINVSDPMNPTILDSIDTPSILRNIQVVEDLAYVAGRGSGLNVIDVSDPGSLSLVALSDTTWHGFSVDVSGNLAFLANTEGGLEIIDVGEPDHPTWVGNYDQPFNPVFSAEEVIVVESNAYLSTGYSLTVLDVSDPSAPGLVGSFASQVYISGFDLAAGHAHLVKGAAGIQIVDVSNATNLVQVGAFDTTGYARDIKVIGNTAYLADDTDGLQIFDITDPAAAFRLAQYNTVGVSYGVDVSGNLAFVADGANGVVIIDVSDPASPVLVSNVPTDRSTTHIFVAGNLLYLSEGYRLRIIDVSDPAIPTQVGLEGGLPDVVLGLSVVDNFVYVANGRYGLSILEVIPPFILNPPVVSAGTIELSWNGGPDVRLQSTTNLSLPNWVDVPETQGLNSKMVPPTEPSAYFRLAR